MRDLNRIYEIVDLITLIWEEYPDWSFGQLVANLLGSEDPFFVEDDELLNFLKDYYYESIR
jgi:hypothetical protein